MQVKSIAEVSAIFSTFIKLPFVVETFVLSIFEWPFKTGFTVCCDPIPSEFCTVKHLIFVVSKFGDFDRLTYWFKVII